MDINIDDKSKIISVWLSNAEQQDKSIRARIDEIASSNNGYKVATFLSGKEDLFENTSALLKRQRKYDDYER